MVKWDKFEVFCWRQRNDNRFPTYKKQRKTDFKKKKKRAMLNHCRVTCWSQPKTLEKPCVLCAYVKLLKCTSLKWGFWYEICIEMQAGYFWSVTWREIDAQAAEMCNADPSYYRMKCHVQQLAVFFLMYLEVICIHLGTNIQTK